MGSRPLCKLQKRCTRLTAASDKVYKLHVYRRWFSPGTPASSTTKTGRHDIDEILLKVALNTINQIKTNQMKTLFLLENLEVQLQKLNSEFYDRKI